MNRNKGPAEIESGRDIEELKERLREAEETLEAIRDGRVDALVACEPSGDQIYTLHTADQGYRILVENMGEGAVILSGKDIFYCNMQFASLLKMETGTLAGTCFLDYVSSGCRSALDKALQNPGKEGYRMESLLTAGNGKETPVNLTLNTFSTEDFSGICVIVTDLTEQKQIQDELAKKNQELQDFTSIASHDLQEPLRKIQTFGKMAEKAAESDDRDPARRYLSRMINAAERMQKLIKSLLSYSRVSTKTNPFEKVSLKTLAGRTVEEFSYPRSEGIEPVFEVGSSMPEIEADPVQISQLLENLLVNAVRYSENGRRPVIRIEGREFRDPRDGRKYAEMRVSDNGIGFDMQYMDRIFRPFERLHGRGEYEGTGMGLAICRKIAERHGGAITAESRPGEGSTFIVRLPVRQKNES